MTETDAEADGGSEAVTGEAATDAEPSPARAANGTADSPTDETVPHVELDLYQLSVRVSGQATDDLDDVEATARGLMDFLVEHAATLDDYPDGRGLG